MLLNEFSNFHAKLDFKHNFILFSTRCFYLHPFTGGAAGGEAPYQEIPYGDGPGPRGPVPDVPQHYAQVPPVPQRQGWSLVLYLLFGPVLCRVASVAFKITLRFTYVGKVFVAPMLVYKFLQFNRSLICS